jgi:hypothetical protein
MLFNILIIWFVTVILINIVIAIYKYYKFNYLFSINIERFVNVKGINILYYITFKSIKCSIFDPWKSKNSLMNMLQAVLFILNNDVRFRNQFKSNKLCIIVCELHTDRLITISDACVLTYNEVINLSASELFNRLRWTNFSEKDLRDITIVIKTI